MSKMKFIEMFMDPFDPVEPRPATLDGAWSLACEQQRQHESKNRLPHRTPDRNRSDVSVRRVVLRSTTGDVLGTYEFQLGSDLR